MIRIPPWTSPSPSFIPGTRLKAGKRTREGSAAEESGPFSAAACRALLGQKLIFCRGNYQAAAGRACTRGAGA